MPRDYLKNIQELKHRWQDATKMSKELMTELGYKGRIQENKERDTAQICRNEIKKAKTHLSLGFGLCW